MNRSPLTSVLIASCAATLALTLTGCGGEDKKDQAGSNPTSTVDPATQTYLDAATKICNQTRNDINALTAKYDSTTPTAAQFAQGLREGSERYLAGIKDLKAVTPPPALAERVSTWLTTFTGEVTKLTTYTIADAKKGTLDAFAKSDPLARDLGLPACTSSGS